ncbi:MAG: hypothetical protein PUB51_08310 [Oscillospiraceae bacterium]|nr:hypothetical protein [Oscillospiraceae bacterium]
MRQIAKFAAILLALALAFSLCACGGKPAQPEPSQTPSPSAEPSAEPSVEPSPEPSAEPQEIPLHDAFQVGKLTYGRKVYRYMGRDVSRLYRFYVPPSYQEGDKLPLMLSLHGSGSSATGNMVESNWLKYAEEEGFIVVFPESVYIHKDGTLSSEGKSYMETKQNDYNYMRWNAASTDPVSAYRVDDIKYMSDLIDIFVEEGCVDPARVYASGMSHGGFLCLRLAQELPEKIAGVGIVAGELIAEHLYKTVEQGPKIVMLNGTEDKVVPIDGMVYDFDGDGVCEYTWAVGQEETCRYFLTQYGMEDDPIYSELPDTDPNDGTTISRYEYRDANGEARIVRYVIEGGGHTWPGGNIDYGVLGRSSKDAQGSELIWNELKDVVNTLQ